MLVRCADRLAPIPAGETLGESNTKATVIEPVLQALGWDVFDHRVVDREHRRRSFDNPVDYALLVDGRARLLVEAKGYGQNLDDPKWATQVISYAAAAGVRWVVLTDGAQWRLFNSHATVPVEDKEYRRASLLDDVEEAAALLELLAPARIVTDELTRLWREQEASRVAQAALAAFFGGGRLPDSVIDEVLSRAVRGPARSDVRNSLRQARVTWAWHPDRAYRDVAVPPPSAVPLSARGAVPSPVTTAQEPTPIPAVTRRQASRTKVSPAERRIKLTDLLASGRLAPGELIAQFDGQRWTGELREDGTITVGDQPCTSPSSAGSAVKKLARGPDLPASVLATDGLAFWSAIDQVTGQRETLKEIRRRAADSV